MWYLARWVRKTAIMMNGDGHDNDAEHDDDGERSQAYNAVEQMQQPTEQHRVSRLGVVSQYR